MERVKMEQGNSDSVDDIRKRLDYLKGLDPAKVNMIIIILFFLKIIIFISYKIVT